MQPLACAVGPDGAPDWFGSAIIEAGHDIVDISEARALFWYHSQPSDLSDLLQRGMHLDWVQLPAAGIEAYRHLLDNRLVWTCAKGVYGEPVAEHALALALAGLRRLVKYGREHTWTTPGGMNLFDARVTIVGGGGIAEALRRLLQPFRARVAVVRRHPRADAGHREVPLEALHDVLRDSDLVVLAVALTPETEGLIGAHELALMPSHAWLVNVSRGAHVVTDDLVVALARGDIGGAALDVTDPEPLPDDHPLWTEPRCLISPHTGNSPDMHRPLLRAFTQRNIGHWVRGEQLEGLVDTELGY